MMKPIKKISSLIAIFLFNLYNICFADVIMPGDTITNHRIQEIYEPNPMSRYIPIGIFVLVIVICAVIIIKRLIEKKKEKSNDDNK